jgi:hypothetical protein
MNGSQYSIRIQIFFFWQESRKTFTIWGIRQKEAVFYVYKILGNPVGYAIHRLK